MTKLNTALMPVYSSILGGIVGYLLNYPMAEQVYQQYVPSQLASPITLFELGIHYADLYFFILLWVIVGAAAGYKTRDPRKGLLYPIVGFISAFVLWSLLRSIYFGTSIPGDLTANLPVLWAGMVPAAFACGAGGVIGLIIGWYRYKQSQARMIHIADPVLDFVPKCPKCSSPVHSNAIFCALCGTEIYKGLGKETVISEEQQTVSTLI